MRTRCIETHRNVRKGCRSGTRAWMSMEQRRFEHRPNSAQQTMDAQTSQTQAPWAQGPFGSQVVSTQSQGACASTVCVSICLNGNHRMCLAPPKGCRLNSQITLEAQWVLTIHTHSLRAQCRPDIRVVQKHLAACLSCINRRDRGLKSTPGGSTGFQQLDSTAALPVLPGATYTACHSSLS
jgi:hypothetical protein